MGGREVRDRLIRLEIENRAMREAISTGLTYLNKRDWEPGDRIEAVVRLSAVFAAAIKEFEATT